MLFLTVAVAAAMDHSGLQDTLSAHVNAAGNVDYATVKAGSTLDAYLTALETASEPAGDPEKMAFWINAYNALTVDLIADNYPLGSIRELDGGDPWGSRRFTVAGQLVTLNHIEHMILRPMGDPRIHAAVNCASRGCPPLSRVAFTGAGLDEQLNAISAAWVTTNGITIDPDTNMVSLSKIFEWYGEDFVPGSELDIPGVEGTQEAAINFISRYVPQHAEYLRAGGYTVGYSNYDWGVNAQ
ncbi:MAG: hypothetical protein ACI8RZ_004259 [Myxococcota bacterium]|jgi:hypothetical protein